MLSKKIIEILELYLNNSQSESLFTIEYLNSNAKIKPENLIVEDQIHGVLQFENTHIEASNNGTLVRSMNLTFLLPLNDDKISNYIAKLEKGITDLNRNTFSVEVDNATKDIVFNNLAINDGNKLATPVNGIEYEIIYITGSVTTTNTLVLSDEQLITINGNNLEGIINTTFSRSTSTDGLVSFSKLLQKNFPNGIQYSITVDLVVYKNNEVHSLILSNALNILNVNLTYDVDALSISDNMTMLGLTTSAVSGDFFKMQVVFVKGAE